MGAVQSFPAAALGAIIPHVEGRGGKQPFARWSRIWLPALAISFVLGAGMPARAQAPSVDTLLVRLFTTGDKNPYEISADFSGTLTLSVRGARLTALAAGEYLEWRAADGIKRRKVIVKQLELPVLLRPFAGAVRRVVEEKVDTSSENPETFHDHDIFMLGELPGRRYVLIGVHRSIVDEMIERFGRPDDKKDPAIRRKIAQWLYTSPSMRESIVRPGPPYALRAVLDEDGLLYELTVFYNWGEVGTRVSWITVGGQPAWQQVSSDATSELAGFGRVDGELILTFTNHCINCRHP